MQWNKAVRRYRFIVAAALAAPWWFVALAGAGEVSFATTVGELGNRNHYRDKLPHERVHVVLPGTLYSPPVAIAVVSSKEVDRTSLLGAMASDYSAWRNDDVQWILSNFVPEDRRGLKVFLANESMREANKAIFSQERTVEVWGTVSYKGYSLVLFTYDNTRSFGAIATFQKTGGEWKRTNALSDDRVFDVVWSAFRAGAVIAK